MRRDEYERNWRDIYASITNGVVAEYDDPSVADALNPMTDAQMRWISAWLAGEGFGRLDAIESPD